MFGTIFTDQQLDIIVPMAATLVGGGLSLAGTFFALQKAKKNEEYANARDRKREDAASAYSAFHKLQNTFNDAANLKSHIDAMFEEANKSGASELEPWAKVKRMIGYDLRGEAISPFETMFLIHAKKAELLNQVHLIQRRVWNIEASAREYNKIREELQLLLSHNVEDLEVEGGTRAGGYLSGRNATIAKLTELTLNNLLGQIMESLEIDVETAFQTASEFKSAAENYFGDDFPRFGFGREDVF